MLKLVHNDPRGWLLHFLRARGVPERAPAGTGFVYVLGVTGAADYVKVGSTCRPHARRHTLATDAHRHGAVVARAWVSPPHPKYKATEATTLAGCRALSPSSTPRGEYFPDLDFMAARREAVRAVLGVHDPVPDGPTVTTRAAGMYEPNPRHLRARNAAAREDRQGELAAALALPDPLSAFAGLGRPAAPVVALPMPR